MMKFPFTMLTDGYKLTHWNQLQDGTQEIDIYFESRTGGMYGFTQMSSYQYIIMEHLVGQVVRGSDIERMKNFCKLYFGDESTFNEVGFTHLVNEHEGRLPIKIRAVREGQVTPINNALMTVVNTCEYCASWIPGYIDSLLTHIWYGSNVATISRVVKGTISYWLNKTGSAPEAVDFMLHDFGFRGATGVEAAAVGGGAHIVNFKGTDTLVAIPYVQQYYNAGEMPANSVVATEHSVMTALGLYRDLEVLDQLLVKYPNGILSVVADSFDIYGFTEGVIERRDKILARNGRFVLRPDSVTKIHGTPAELVVELLDMLWSGFGGTISSTGHKILHDQIRVLWGDGITEDDINTILSIMAEAGYAAENIVFGMGGGLLQKHDRDTQRYTFKCSAQLRNNEWVDVQKKAFGKSSKAGRLALVVGEEGIVTRRIEDVREGEEDLMIDVFENGDLLVFQQFDDIREVADRTWAEFEARRLAS